MCTRKPRCTYRGYCSGKSRRSDRGDYRSQCLAKDWGQTAGGEGCQWRIIPKPGE